MLWGFSLQFWQVVVFWLWAVTAVGGGVAVVAALGSSIISYYVTAETEAAAKVEIGNAKAVAGQANESAGKSHERAASLEKEAANARLRQEELARDNLKLQQEIEATRQQANRIEMRVAPRTLSAAQKEQILQTLGSSGGKIAVIMAINSDPEASAYGDQIVSALKDAGISITVTRSSFAITINSSEGLRHYNHGVLVTSRCAPLVRRALENAGIQLTEMPPLTDVSDITIGLKPPGI